MTTNYLASLEIRRLRKDGSVDETVPKRDGQRFDCEFTLKLLIDTYYEFSVNLRPPLPLHSVSVQGTAVTIVDLSGPEGGQGSTYSFKYDTLNTEADKKRKRSTVKMYKLEDEEHLTWGTPLHHIDFECEQRPGSTNMHIMKTHFL